jgi:hypothetical protein
MRYRLLAIVFCATLNVAAQAPNTSVVRELASILTFEATHNGAAPFGWGGGPPATISVDEQTVHGGRWSVRLERDASSAEAFSTRGHARGDRTKEKAVGIRRPVPASNFGCGGGI